MSGKYHSEETKRKIGEKSKNRIHTKEWRKKVSEANKGKKNPFYGKSHTKESRKKISAIQQSIPLNEWKGFVSFEPYTSDFNKSFKRKIRDRDNYCCVMCNKQEEELGRKLDVHHIDYNKLNSFPQNCVSLCHSCHAKTNINRTAWVVFFQRLLNERYGYQYTQNQKIILNFMEG